VRLEARLLEREDQLMAKTVDDLLIVDLLEAKPNPLFTEEQRQMVRFLRYTRAVPCAECGRKKRILWTMLCEFWVFSMEPFIAKHGEKIHPPLTGVCQTHIMGPAIEKENAKANRSSRRRR
jgi:hypothetical protein